MSGTLIYLKKIGNNFFNTLRPRQNGRHFADDIFKCIFFNENISISIKISLQFVLKGPINNIPALVQIMAWRWSGDKPLSEPRMKSLLTHICVTRPQWVNPLLSFSALLILIECVFVRWGGVGVLGGVAWEYLSLHWQQSECLLWGNWFMSGTPTLYLWSKRHLFATHYCV